METFRSRWPFRMQTTPPASYVRHPSVNSITLQLDGDSLSLPVPNYRVLHRLMLSIPPYLVARYTLDNPQGLRIIDLPGELLRVHMAGRYAVVEFPLNPCGQALDTVSNRLGHHIMVGFNHTIRLPVEGWWESEFFLSVAQGGSQP